jgi:methylmalonyl-CoA/ethylmalonyl-CoA epimerase
VSGGRRLDHVGLVVADTERALDYFSRQLGMEIVEQEDLEVPPVRVTFLSAGGVMVQLCEPLPGNAALKAHLAEHGEGLHHLCFEVDDLLAGIRELSSGAEPDLIIEGGHRRSAFVPGEIAHGLRLELTQERDGPA